MKKLILQTNLNNLLLFSSLFIAFKFALTLEYTFPFGDIIQITEYDLGYLQKITYNYKLINCPDSDRKTFLTTNAIKTTYNYKITQNKLEKSIEYQQDGINFCFKVVEICMKEVYLQTESILINKKSLQSFTFKSKPLNYNKSMKAIPFIIGVNVDSEKNSFFIENTQAEEDGFVFNFSSSLPESVQSIDINYLYFVENISKQYYKLDQFLSNKHKKLDKLLQLNEEKLDQINVKTNCKKDNISKNCGIVLGVNGFDQQKDDLISINLKIEYELIANKNLQIKYSNYSNNKTINGITSQLVIFEMVRCNSDQSSKAKINHKERCIENCADGEYQDNDSDRDIFICSKCDQACKTCDKNGCLTCPQNQYLFHKKCQQPKPINSDCKPQSNYFSCTLCPENCTNCNSQDCTSCQSSYYLLDKKCTEKEPFSTNCKLETSYYNCNKCQKNCPRHCDDSQKCINCLDNKHYYKGQCQEKQPVKTYKKDDEYFDCHQTCLTCKDGNESSCLSCDIEFILDENSCKCKDSKKGLNTSTYKCEDCFIVGCSKCTNNSQECEKCENKFNLINKKCECKETFKLNGSKCECLNETQMQYNSNIDQCKCPDNNMYFDVNNNSCQKNPFSKYCEQAETLKPECQKCENGFKLKQGVCNFCDDENSCNCSLKGENFTYDSKTKDCKCKDKYPYEVFEVIKKNRYCTKMIPNGFFCDVNNICQECKENCQNCKDQIQCSLCSKGYFLWSDKCLQNCPSSQNLIENTKKNICECPEGSTYKILNGQKEGICLYPLKQQSISVENSFMGQKNDDAKNENTIITDNNIVKLIFNRDFQDDEKSNFDIKFDSLIKNTDYFIKKTVFIGNMIIAEIEVVQNQRIESLSYSLNGKSETIKQNNTILTTSSYNKNQEASKKVTQNIQKMSNALNPKSEGTKNLLDTLKQFQILCLVSNFVQLLGPITLFKDSLPPLVYLAAELGASFIFDEIPSSQQTGESQEHIESTSVSEILPPPYSIMQGLGLKRYLYSNFIVVHIILDLSSFLILILLLVRKVHQGKQYSLKIVDLIANIIVKYLQTSITCILFSIAYSLYFAESQKLAIFQIFIILLLFFEFIYLICYRSESYVSKYLSNFFENINHKAYASKSYILVQFFKKFFIISAIICLCQQTIICTILIAIVFFCNGIYILKYRFFESNVINIFKIIQECFIGMLFIMLAIVVKKYKDLKEKSEIQDEDLQSIEKYSFVIIIFFSTCLLTSLTLFVIRLIIQIHKILKYIHSKYLKKQDEKEIENIEYNLELNDTQLYGLKVNSSSFNVKLNSFHE